MSDNSKTNEPFPFFIHDDNNNKETAAGEQHERVTVPSMIPFEITGSDDDIMLLPSPPFVNNNYQENIDHIIYE